ncbi:hypothetical protein SAE02_21910 [Skermanella aerolata]|uniref:UPF0114 protein SAE02_21910 n=1 Tax=Skermanella aerolata TaxID=393310 RepID=A0A512DNI2_9PROT|nr:YqhA family protein [Skermanella aerolata]GEO38043.1 hypothetical protein SAE02_21910 [Skermanella aerolata]
MHRPPTLHDRIDLEPVRHRHAPTLPIPVMEPRDRAAPVIGRLIGRVIVLSRYILVVFYLGLIVALGIYAAVYARMIYAMALSYDEMSGVEALATMLSLIDFALVASLAVMVIISNYENFVGPIVSDSNMAISWLAHLDPGALKIKIGATIITISSIYLLKVLIDVEQYRSHDLMWKLAIFVTFILAALALVLIDRIGVVYRDATGKSRIVHDAAHSRHPDDDAPSGPKTSTSPAPPPKGSH